MGTGQSRKTLLGCGNKPQQKTLLDYWNRPISRKTLLGYGNRPQWKTLLDYWNRPIIRKIRQVEGTDLIRII
jgi:hypothetical protein